MTDYGRDGVLGAATALPATSALNLLFVNNAELLIVLGLFILSAMSFLVFIGYVVRYTINLRRLAENNG